MTANRSFKQRVRARMTETGEKYTEARRALVASDDEKQVIREDDEATRLKHESCPGCEADLGSAIEELDKCPQCGEAL